MSKADKMFLKLGYEKTRDGIDCWTIYENSILKISFEIGFGQALFFENKKENDDIVLVDKELLQAINQKCKELKWID